MVFQRRVQRHGPKNLLYFGIAKAANRTIRALNLSVDRNNYAAELYKKLEFTTIGNSEDSHWTMMLKI